MQAGPWQARWAAQWSGSCSPDNGTLGSPEASGRGVLQAGALGTCGTAQTLSMVETWQQWNSDLTHEENSVTTGNRVGEKEGEEEEQGEEEIMMMVVL